MSSANLNHRTPPCNNRLPPPFAPTIVPIRMQKNIKTANPPSASIMYNRTVLPCSYRRQPGFLVILIWKGKSIMIDIYSKDKIQIPMPWQPLFPEEMV